jgi:hypothetical protein
LPHRPTVVVGLVVLAWATAGPALAADAAFSNQTLAAGLNVAHSTNGFSQFGYAGGGAVGDFNRDGWMDVFMCSGGNGGKPDYLFINDGDGTFTNRAAEWGLTAVHKGKAVCVGDFDHNGWPDLYVTSAGPVGQNAAPGHHKLYRNNGNGTFTDVAATAGVKFADPSVDSAWTCVFGDYDLDGDLDLFVGGFAGTPSNTEHRLFRNNGNSTFTDVTAAIGLFAGVGPVACLSARFADMDGDRFPELLLGGDFKGTGQYVGSRYFKNDGDGTFTDIPAGSGTGDEENGMGQTLGDFDNDSRPDWYVTSIYYVPSNWTGNKLYRNLGGHSYTEIAAEAGCAEGGYGWGTVAVDVNHDGWEDLTETSGDASPNSPFYSIPSKLWLNTGKGTFVESAAATGFVHSIKGRAMLRLDYDNDGDQDILIFRNNGLLTLLRNDVAPAADARWLRIFLDTAARPDLAPDGVGTKIVVTAGGVARMRLLDAAMSFLGTSEPSAHFGLAAATVAQSIELHWADGSVTTLHDVPTNQTLVIAAPSACPADLNGSGKVDAGDLAALLSAWGTAGSADLDGDGAVGAADLAVLLSAWGDC